MSEAHAIREEIEGFILDALGGILSVTEATDAILDLPLPEAAAGLAAAVRGIADDYMTSDAHHPGYVLIPAAKFDQLLRAALKTGAPQ